MFEKARISDGLARKLLCVAKHIYFERIYDIKVTKNDTLKLKPPYLILANHVSVWDPVLINLYVNYPIQFVASDVWFQKPLLKDLLNYLGAIPKTKNVSDYFTIKKILQACKDNKIVGIFPEGKRTWDGITANILFSTAKLIKHLKIPVVTVLLKGACLARPRWASNNRHGRIEISYDLSLSSNQVKHKSVNDIYQAISKKLYHDEYEWQHQHQFTYRGRFLADGLEKFLFACPNCNSIGNNTSQGNYLKCTCCNYKVKYNELGYLNALNNETYFSNTRDWNIWQHSLLKKNLAATKANIIEDCNAIYYLGNKHKQPVKVAKGRLKVNLNELIFTNTSGEDYQFLISNLEGFNVKWNDHLDFYYNKELHRFGFTNNGSAYKWVELLKYITCHNKQNLIVK